ncbi:hypothetical protein Tco_1387297, partial [Tanacetum coccineum]
MFFGSSESAGSLASREIVSLKILSRTRKLAYETWKLGLYLIYVVIGSLRVPILRLNDSIDCVYKMPDRSFVVLYEVLEGGGFEIVECSVLIWVVVVEDVDRDGGGGGSSVGDSMKVEGCSDKVLSVDKSMVQGGLEYDSGVVDGVMEIFKCGGLGDGSKWVKVGVSVGEQRFRWKSVYD